MEAGPVTVIHWMNKGGADCGAPAGSFVSPYAHAVTCRECLIALKIDILERRLEAHALVFGPARYLRLVK